MRKAIFPYLKTLVLVFGVLLLAANVAFAQVPVSVQNVVGKAGTAKDINIVVGDVSNLSVISYQFTLTYDPAVVNITNVTAEGTISAAMPQIVVNTTTPGTVQVAASATEALAGSGTLIKLTASLVAPGSSALTLTGFTFNEGTPAVTVTNGTVTVPTLSVSLPASAVDTARVNQLFNIPITTEDITGKGVLSYQFGVTFDPSIIKIVDLSMTNTLSAGITNYVLDTTQAGKVIAAVSGTSTLTGSGVLVNLVARAIKAGPTDLKFINFQYNEGSPAVGAIDGGIVVTKISTKPGVPGQFGLDQNYPNPFNPSTKISFSLPKESDVTLEVFNILGMKVRTLIAGSRMNASNYSVEWDGKDNAGLTVPSGVYLYRIHAGQFDATKKMVMMK